MYPCVEVAVGVPGIWELLLQVLHNDPTYTEDFHLRSHHHHGVPSVAAAVVFLDVDVDVDVVFIIVVVFGSVVCHE